MVTKKKIAFIIAFVLIVGMVAFVFITDQYNWSKAVEASSGFPYQIGLTKAVVIPCLTTPTTPPVCAGGTLCYVKDPATCTLYSDVTGVPAGGMGSNALFSDIAITKAGLTSGGQLIAGGMSPNLMDNGVLASRGGCFGCLARVDITDKVKNWFNKVYIAIFEE